MPGRTVTAVLVALVGAVTLAAQTPQQSPQVLRAGAFLVQVDAYPTRDGLPITGLTTDDFEILEDGKPQKIDSVRFLEFPIWTPDAARRDPNTQRESFELAGDPTNRLFVVYLNRISWQNGNYVEPALFEFLDRSMGPRDYVAVMTQMQGPGDIVFGQLSTAFKSEIRDFLNIVDHFDARYLSDSELELMTCFPGPEAEAIIGRWRADDVYRDLEGLITMLGAIRETQSTLVFVSEDMIDPSGVRALTSLPRRPTQIVPPAGQLPPARGRGSFSLPAGVRELEDSRCEALARVVAEPWSADRFRTLLASARTANVALSPINPRGLTASHDVAVTIAAERTNDLMRTMASETGGLAVVNLNDMHAGFRRVADRLASHYLLGYHSTNTNADGRVRRITVKLKATGATIPARREYRAPSAAELTPPPAPAGPNVPAATSGVQQALWALDRDDRDDETMRRPVDPAMPRLFHAPSPPAAPWQPVTTRQFSRTQRLRLEWPLTAGVAGPATTVRVLNRDGGPLPVALTVAHDQATQTTTADLRLAPLAAGTYILEATHASGLVQHVAFRIR